MKKIIALFPALIACSILSSYSSLKNPSCNEIFGIWTWEKSISIKDHNYTSTPHSMGFRKKIEFTQDGLIITYKNGFEIRSGRYAMEKGIGANDSLEHDLISFEGSVYVIENITSKNLTLRHNVPQGSISVYKR
ncbi:hypothetical protein LPB248_00475 [Flavobacterium sp. LPB0248]|uniref:hypothetical protein n=1 Tax=Flavobacterium sp. LPB0248 TaxID=2614441 RepID=UPI0015A4F0D5|nr:hypothetical protein [Flavobacterium sp. LPB0248]QLC64804.1 hypothetical protein LPB248_00475 [Flavobacterium sp. LPB0248]